LKNFIDEAVITVKGGDGGDGSASFHRAPFVPKGGPDGGDGGRGGNVVFRSSAQLFTLEDVILKRRYAAPDGKPGAGGRKSGKSGKDIIIELPVGSIITDLNSGETLADMSSDRETIIAARGGRGGRGNVHFATSRNRTPRQAESGRKGEERRLAIELKLLADVGLLGKPNAGKSTLLAALTRATPRVADYPFTTLTPNLGVVPVGGYGRFIMADIPGVIEGASQGKGLGHRFLRHIERTRIIVVLIETPEPSYRRVYLELVEELERFSAELAALPRIVARSKSDLARPSSNRERFRFDLTISSLTGEGLTELVDVLADRLGVPKGLPV